MSSLTTYEKERNARIASNQQLLQSLGLGIAMPTGPAACRARCPLRLTPPRDRQTAAWRRCRRPRGSRSSPCGTREKRRAAMRARWGASLRCCAAPRERARRRSSSPGSRRIGASASGPRSRRRKHVGTEGAQLPVRRARTARAAGRTMWSIPPRLHQPPLLRLWFARRGLRACSSATTRASSASPWRRSTSIKAQAPEGTRTEARGPRPATRRGILSCRRSCWRAFWASG